MSSLFMTKYYNDPDYKAKHNQYMTEKQRCVCGSLVCRGNMSTHKQTKKHKKFLEQNDRLRQLQMENEKLKHYLMYHDREDDFVE